MRFSQFVEGMRQAEGDGGRQGVTFDAPGDSRMSSEVIGEAIGDQPYQSVAAAPESHRHPLRVPQGNPRYEQYFHEARKLVESAMRGNRYAGLQLQEAMTTSDFATYFGDVLDRSVLANYAETPYTWDMYLKRATLNDFRLARIFRVDRGASVLDGPITPNSFGASGSGSTGLEQISEYPLRKRAITGFTDQLYKFGARMDFSFETMTNDDLQALQDTPALFGRAARRTEEKRATKIFVSSTGPNATFFSTANKNLINGTVAPGCPYTNPPFSLDALKWALVVLSLQRDLDGEPISIESAVLVYPPQLKADVENVLNATELWANMEGGNVTTPAAGTTTSGLRLITANWARKIVAPALNYYLPVVDTTSGGTGWYVFASPKGGRPAAQLSFLRGRNMPQIFMKLPNQVAIGEGSMGPGAGSFPGTSNVNPMEGDFEADSIDYKIRHFIGGTLLDPVCAVASNGTGV